METESFIIIIENVEFVKFVQKVLRKKDKFYYFLRFDEEMDGIFWREILADNRLK